MHGPDAVRQTNEQGTSDSAKEDDDGTRSEPTTVEGGRGDVLPPSRLSNIAVAGMGPSVTTIRSRVTVVCAECKKQKLRCDRRIPCESCVKRNTISRCIYTPAAIEKVDMTSINNRLRVVEGSLNALGVPTQAFQQPHLPPPQLNLHQPGVLPFLTAGGMGASLLGAQATTLPVNPSPPRYTTSSDFTDDVGLSAPPPRILAMSNDERCASTVAPLGGVVKLWVREITEGIGDESPSMSIRSKDAQSSLGHPQAARGNLATSKHLKLDLEPIDRESKGGLSAFGCRAKQVLGARQWLELHAGLGVSSTTAEVSQPDPETTAEQTINKSPVVAKCISDVYSPVTTYLLTQLPCRRDRREMLVRLGQLYLIEGFNCMPFGAFCSKIEALFFPASGEGPEQTDATREPMPALSAIAEAAAGLAVGALLWATEPTADTTSNTKVLRRIVLQSMEPSVHWIDPGDHSDPVNEGTPDRPHVETAFALHRLAQLAIAIHTARHGHAAQDVSTIHTRILNSYYLILAHSTSGGFPDSLLPPELASLVGSLVWEARAMGLGIDPDEFDPLDEASSRSAILAASGNQGTEISFKREDVDESSDSAPRGEGMCLFMKETRRRLWWWVVWLDLFVSDAYGYKATILPDEFSTRLPAVVDDTSFRPDSEVLPPPDNTCIERTNIFYINKVRVLEVVKRAPVRVFRGGSVPKSTGVSDPLAATQKVADEIAQCLEELPERYRLDAVDGEFPPVSFSQLPMTSLRPPSEIEEERKTIKAILVCQRCDMAFHAHHTLLRLYTSRLPSSSSVSRHANTSRIGHRIVSADQQFVGLRAVRPALAVVQAAEMQMAYAPDMSRGTFHMHMFPQRLFDAAVVLAHTAIQQPLYTASIVTEAVRSARDVLSHVLNSGTSQVEGNTDQRTERTEAELVIDVLLKRAEKAMARSTPIVVGRKRKHEDIESDTTRFDTPFRFPFLGTGIVNIYRPSVQAVTSCDGLERGGLTGVTAQPSTSTGPRSSRVAQGSDSCSRHSSDVGSGRRGKAVPVISIRQRVRDRRSDRTTVDASRTESSPIDPGFRAVQPFLLPPRPSSQQAYSAGPSTSSSPSFFPGESNIGSPVSPASQYDRNNGTRLMNSGVDYPLRANDSQRGMHPAGAASLQRPSPLPTTYHYPVPNIGDPSYSVPVSLQHHHDHLDGTTVAGSAEYGVDPTHLNQNVRSGHDDQRSSGVQQWRTSHFDDQPHESLAAPSPHPAGAYPPDQNTQRHHPPSWTTGENMNSASMAPPWNVGLFNNWNHNNQ